MSPDMPPSEQKHGPLLGDQSGQFEAEDILPTNPLTPIGEYGTLIEPLIEALHSFDPATFEVQFLNQSKQSEYSSCIRSIEIGSVKVWERFVATLQSKSATQQNTETDVLFSFIDNNLR